MFRGFPAAFALNAAAMKRLPESFFGTFFAINSSGIPVAPPTGLYAGSSFDPGRPHWAKRCQTLDIFCGSKQTESSAAENHPHPLLDSHSGNFSPLGVDSTEIE